MQMIGGCKHAKVLSILFFVKKNNMILKYLFVFSRNQSYPSYCYCFRYLYLIVHPKGSIHRYFGPGSTGWFDTGYPHDGCADKESYPQDGRADKDSYPHDRHNQYIMFKFIIIWDTLF